MEKINSISFKGENSKKQKKNIKGSLAAYAVGSLTTEALLPLNLVAVKGLQKPSKSLTTEEKSIVNAAIDNVLNNKTNLSQKGVVINNVANDTKSFFDIFDFPNWLKELTDPIYAAAKGKNAFFSDKAIGEFSANGVLINRDKLPLAAFHEMGHAFNFNNSAFWKTMQKMRVPGMALATSILSFVAFSKESKPKEGQELTKAQKFKNNLRKYSPALVVASMLPTVLEEGMATLRGNKWAREVFEKTPELAKKVSKTNKWGLISYCAATAFLALGAHFARKVKDSSTAKKESFFPSDSKIRAHQG